MTAGRAPTSRRLREDQGFTLIELLVVIVIIGILAAIGVNALLKQRVAAYDAAAKTDIRTLASFEEAYLVNMGQYGSFAAMAVDAFSSAPSPRVTVQLYYDGGTGFCLTAKHALSPTTWFYDNQAGGLQPRGTAACPVTVGVDGGNITGA